MDKLGLRLGPLRINGQRYREVIGDRARAADIEIAPVEREFSFEDIITAYGRCDKRKADIPCLVFDGEFARNDKAALLPLRDPGR